MHTNAQIRKLGVSFTTHMVVIIAISVSALIALIALNWLLLCRSVITCDLSVTRVFWS